MTEVPAPDHSGRRGVRVTRNVLRGVFAAVLVVLLVLIVVRFTAPGGVLAEAPATSTATPTATATPTPTPTATPTPTVPAPAGGGSGGGGTGGSGGGSGGGGGGGSGGGGGGGGGGETETAPAFTSFSATTDVDCPVPSTPLPGGFEADPSLNTPPIHLDWASTGAVEAYIGADTADAQLAPYSSVDLSGSFDYEFFCPDDSVTWTVTLVGADGTKTSETATIVNSGYTG
jgi:hypothetical protein